MYIDKKVAWIHWPPVGKLYQSWENPSSVWLNNALEWLKALGDRDLKSQTN